MAKVKRKKAKGSDATMAYVRAQRGLDRQRFLEENGDMRQWIPRRIVTVNRKRRADRESCRKFKF
tara:strand:- start:474 stop:668 length:195 start_codon:yes stop_codon:yes gene_type:complete